MSYSQTTNAFTAGQILRGSSLAVMGQTVGVIIAAGVLAAIYQLVHDEAHATLTHMRKRGAYRHMRNEVILLNTLGSSLDPVLQEILLTSRSSYKTAMKLLVDPELSSDDRLVIRQSLRAACQADS